MQEAQAATMALAYAGAGIGLGLAVVGAGLGMIVIGAALGIGRFAAAAAESIARQPAAADKITGAVNLPLFLLEGVAILAIMSFVFIFADMLGPWGGIGIGLGFSVPVATAVLGLEIIVVLVQAYVFTLLTAVFIGMAIHVHH